MKPIKLCELIVLVSHMIEMSLSGYIYPDRPNSIVPYTNNVYNNKIEEIGPYEFYFWVQSRISTKPKINIYFDQLLFPTKVL